jgi:hypothetical protein
MRILATSKTELTTLGSLRNITETERSHSGSSASAASAIEDKKGIVVGKWVAKADGPLFASSDRSLDTKGRA